MHRDQLGTFIQLNSLPKRIISLVPSQTELLFDLGLENEIVGVTKFCAHPEHARKEKGVIGGTKKFDFAFIDQLSPDLIIGNKEENYKEGIEMLKEKYPVWMSDISTMDDALAMIKCVGEICGKAHEAATTISKITSAFDLLKKKSPQQVMYLIWRKPWMAAGAGTFIHSMIDNIGWKNSMANKPRYPELSHEDIRRIDPELILLSSEPYPFSEKHIEEIQALIPSAKVMLVDGEMFSWYGTRLMKAPEYFNSLHCSG